MKQVHGVSVMTWLGMLQFWVLIVVHLLIQIIVKIIFECHSTDNINGNVGAAEQNSCINLITAIQKEFASQW